VGKAMNQAMCIVSSENLFDLARRAFQHPDSFIKYNNCMSIDDSVEWMYKIMDFNNFDLMEFVGTIFDVMDRITNKRNAIMFKGPPNAGKTLVAESLAYACIFYCNVQSFSKGQQFPFMDAVGTRCFMINEPRFTDEYGETLKNILEGCPTHVNVKYESKQMLSRTPVLITSNHKLSMYLQQNPDVQERAFQARMFTFNFLQMEDLKDCRGKIHPGVWYRLGLDLARENTFVKGIKEDEKELAFQ
jgi:hypothetical protein